MRAVIHMLEQFSGSGNKHALRLINGRDLLGWLSVVYDVNDHADYEATDILFMHAPGIFDGPESLPGDESEIWPFDERIPLSEIDLSSLYYWDDKAPEKGWQSFSPSED